MGNKDHRREIEMIRVQLIDVSSRTARMMSLCPRPEDEQRFTSAHTQLLLNECKMATVVLNNITKIVTALESGDNGGK